MPSHGQDSWQQVCGGGHLEAPEQKFRSSENPFDLTAVKVLEGSLSQGYLEAQRSSMESEASCSMC